VRGRRWWIVIAFGADEVEDDLLGSVGGDFVLDIDGMQAAEEKVAGVGHDGAAARGEAVLGEEEQEAGEELVDFGGGLELGEITEEFGGEGGIGIAVVLGAGMAGTEAGSGVGDAGVAMASARGVVGAAG
jgi:hypothetical protein